MKYYINVLARSTTSQRRGQIIEARFLSNMLS